MAAARESPQFCCCLSAYSPRGNRVKGAPLCPFERARHSASNSIISWRGGRWSLNHLTMDFWKGTTWRLHSTHSQRRSEQSHRCCTLCFWKGMTWCLRFHLPPLRSSSGLIGERVGRVRGTMQHPSKAAQHLLPCCISDQTWRGGSPRCCSPLVPHSP